MGDTSQMTCGTPTPKPRKKTRTKEVINKIIDALIIRSPATPCHLWDGSTNPNGEPVYCGERVTRILYARANPDVSMKGVRLNRSGCSTVGCVNLEHYTCKMVEPNSEKHKRKDKLSEAAAIIEQMKANRANNDT